MPVIDYARVVREAALRHGAVIRKDYVVMELLAGAVAEGEDAFFGLTGAANAHISANPYLDRLGNYVRGHCLLHGWERLAAHALALIVLLRAGEADSP